MPVLQRIVVHVKDVLQITGISERSACRLLAKIRKENNLPPDAFVSIELFCKKTFLKYEDVCKFLK